MMLDTDAKAPATVVIDRLRLEGYSGGITILKDYLREVRPVFVGARSYQRTSYLPGEIGQTDWWPSMGCAAELSRTSRGPEVIELTGQ